jgi:hypothetical protein
VRACDRGCDIACNKPWPTSRVGSQIREENAMDLMSFAVMGAAALYAVAMIVFVRIAP